MTIIFVKTSLSTPINLQCNKTLFNFSHINLKSSIKFFFFNIELLSAIPYAYLLPPPVLPTVITQVIQEYTNRSCGVCLGSPTSRQNLKKNYI